MRRIVAGDVFSTSGQQRVDRGDLPPQLRQMLNAPAYALQEVRLPVVSTAPKGIVQITPETEIELRPAYEEPKEARRREVDPGKRLPARLPDPAGRRPPARDRRHPGQPDQT